MSNKHGIRVTNTLERAVVNDNARLHVGNNYTEVHNYGEPKRNQLLFDLRSIDPRDEKTRIENTKGGLLKTLCQWILDHKDFNRWRSDENRRLLWIRGDAGKGKTMLVCGIIDELSIPQAQSLSFFFCQGTDPKLDNTAEVLRGLMYMLILQRQDLIKYLEDTYEHAGKQLFEGENAFYRLARLFTSMLRDPLAKDVYLIVDALDECERDRQLLLNFINDRTSDSSAKWIISSRFKRDIDQTLGEDDKRVLIDLEANERHVDLAVHNFIHHKVSRIRGLRKDAQKRQNIRRELRSRANGTFLWIDVVIRELQKASPGNMLDVLHQTPSNMGPLYDGMMEKMKSQMSNTDGSLCLRVLSVASLVYEPLALSELGELAQFHKGKDHDDHIQAVIDICGSFLTVRDDHVSLINQSVKEYVLGLPDTVLGKSLASHDILARRSIDCMSNTLRRDIYGLNHPAAPIPQDSPSINPLASVRYSCLNWVNHLAAGTSALKEDEIALKFLEKHSLHWIEALALLKSLPAVFSALDKLLNLVNSDLGASRLEILVRDLLRFVRRHYEGIEQWPLQLYSSALIFSPSASEVGRLFQDEKPRWISMQWLTGDNMEWGPWVHRREEAHCGGVKSLAFSPDGRHYASAPRLPDETAKLWDAATGQLQRTFAPSASDDEKDQCTDYSLGMSVAFSPNGSLLATTGYRETKIWALGTGECLHTLEGFVQLFQPIAFSPDSRLLAYGCYPRLLDVETGHLLQLEAKRGRRWVLRAIEHLGFTQNGLHLMTMDKRMVSWDTTTGKPTEDITCLGLQSVAFPHYENKNECFALIYRDEVEITNIAMTERKSLAIVATNPWLTTLTTPAISSDGSLIAVVNENVIEVWNTISGQRQLTLRGHSGHIDCLAFSPTNDYIISGSSRDEIILWQTKSKLEQEPHEDKVDKVSDLAFSSDSRDLMVRSKGGLSLWDTATGQCQQTFEYIWSSNFISPNGRYFVLMTESNITVWDFKRRQIRWTSAKLEGGINCCSFSPNGRYLVTSSKRKVLRLWDVATGTCRQTFELPEHCEKIFSHDSVEFSPGGNQVVAICDAGNPAAEVWDIQTGKCLRTLEEQDMIEYSPNSGQIMSSSDDNTIKLWDVVTGQCQRVFEGTNGIGHFVALSPDGRHLISAPSASERYEDDKTISLWDVVTGERKWCRSLERSRFISACFSPGLPRVAVTSEYYPEQMRKVEIWDLNTGQLQKVFIHGEFLFEKFTVDEYVTAPRFSPHHDEGCVAFSPDDSQMASARGSRIRLWDIATGNCMHTLKGHASSLAYFSDSRQLASESYNHILIWNVETGQLQRKIATIEEHIDLERFIRTMEKYPARRPCGQDFTISDDGKWIQHGYKNILWIPSNFRSQVRPETGSTIAVECPSGGVLLLKFALDLIDIPKL